MEGLILIFFMKNFFTAVFTFILASGLSAQTEKGTMTFGAGQTLISTASAEGFEADASYFVGDGLMLSISISGSTTVGDENDWYYAEAQNNLGLGIRYYINQDDGLFTGLNLNKSEFQKVDSNGYYENENDGSPDMKIGIDVRMKIGYSKEIIKHILFEPLFTLYFPSGPGKSPIYYGLGAQFRFAF